MSTIPFVARLGAVPRAQLLRLALMADALVSGVNGVAYLVLAGPLADLFAVPASFVRAIGGLLVVFGIAVWIVARQPRPWAAGVIAANVPWVLASLCLVLFDLHEPSTVGLVWTVLQAIVVAAFAALQAYGLLRPE